MTARGFLLRFVRAQDGSTLVELALVSSVFVFMLFGLIDFTRLAFSAVLAEKATETAVRMAVVRPVACPGVPAAVSRGLVGTLSVDLPNGTSCEARQGLCAAPGTVSCTGRDKDPTSAAVWAQVRPLLPSNATIANLRFVYAFDPALNRVGAPYVPVVSVEIADLPYDYLSPLGAMAAFAGTSRAASLGESFAFPSMSASLPAEDLK